MKRTFEVSNVKCGGCAGTLKSKLKDEFGDVDVDLDVMPRKITLEITDDKIELLGKMLKKMGYPFTSEDLSFTSSTSAKAKSFVSCAIGKING